MKFIIYGTEGCWACDAAKLFLDNLGWEYTYRDIREDNHYDMFEATSKAFASGHLTTIPQIYMLPPHEDSLMEHVGGYKDLVERFKKYHDG